MLHINEVHDLHILMNSHTHISAYPWSPPTTGRLCSSGKLPQALPSLTLHLSLPVSYKAGLLWGRDRCGFSFLCLLISQQWIHLSHILFISSPHTTSPLCPPPPLLYLCSSSSVHLYSPQIRCPLLSPLSISYLVIFFPSLIFPCHQPACPPQFPVFCISLPPPHLLLVPHSPPRLS